MKKKLIIGAIAIVVIGAGAFAVTAFANQAAQYLTEPAVYESIVEKVEATGDIKGEKKMTYYAKVAAPVSEYNLKVGDFVKGGSNILSYDCEDLERALEQATLTAESSENTMNGQIAASDKRAALYNKAKEDSYTYMGLYAMVRANNDSLDQAQYQENWDVNCIADSIAKSISEKQAEINNKEYELTVTTDEERINQLNEEIRSLSNDVANLQKDRECLPPTNYSPEEYAKSIVNGNWMSDIMRNWTQSTTIMNTYEADILNSYQKDQLQNAYDLSELSVGTAEDMIAKAKSGVVADFNGIITESFVQSGAVITKGSPLFTIESCDDLMVEVAVSKFDIGKVSVGQRAVTTVADRKYEGSVSEIRKLATKNNSDKAKVNVCVHIDKPDDYVYLGLEADVTIMTNETPMTVVMPAKGYYSDDEGSYCYLIKDGTVVKQRITIGAESDEYYEVLDGIAPGDLVITDAVTDESIGERAVAQ